MRLIGHHLPAPFDLLRVTIDRFSLIKTHPPYLPVGCLERRCLARDESWPMFLVQFRKEVFTLIVETRYEHIVLDKNNVPMIAGTTMKVVELVLDHQAYGWSPEELHFQHPYLTLGQIYSAFAYYWDHQEEFEQDIERRLQRVDQIQQLLGLENLKI